ncbi:hypothetical protein [Paractinoplanes rishiriensis]|uniref:Uncharacterized protein n=1 Tax=Paractinoplanes rishiriensis TaxID=1050105 RepID=A0A919MTJ0_9ACTN|nr:hypothetical protein [Actinoplanes rishiriensis]GIE94314.1 hypothetical protein Ari01nite_17790 [Actinoplanes rishiriensis]
MYGTSMPCGSAGCRPRLAVRDLPSPASPRFIDGALLAERIETQRGILATLKAEEEERQAARWRPASELASRSLVQVADVIRETLDRELAVMSLGDPTETVERLRDSFQDAVLRLAPIFGTSDNGHGIYREAIKAADGAPPGPRRRLAPPVRGMRRGNSQRRSMR